MTGPTRHRPERTFALLPAAAVLELSAPPTVVHDDHPPGAAATVGPLLGALSGVGLAVVARNAAYLVLSVLLAAGGAATGWLARRSSRRRQERTAARGRAAYVEHVRVTRLAAEAAAQQQRDALEGTYPAAARLLGLVRDAGALYERRPDHDDFGAVRVGTGQVPALVVLRATSTGGPYAEVDEACATLAAESTTASRHLDAAPVRLVLPRPGTVALVGDRRTTVPLVRAWLAQLAALHSPDDLAIAVDAGPDRDDGDSGWDWVRWLPHSRPTCAGDRAAWTVQLGGPVQTDGTTGSPRTRLVLCEVASQVPGTCDARVDVRPDGTVTLRGRDGATTGGILPDRLHPTPADQLARWLAPHRQAAHAEGAVEPTLAELLADPVRASDGALTVPLGVGADGSAVLLDLREAAAGGHGPHGLLVGATGSGKSELLRTLVSGLAARHTVVEIALLLVDFKGGAAFARFAELPQLAGLVTNLADDPALLPRVREALEGELDERQRRLRDAGCDSATTYTRLAVSSSRPPMPSLLVVVDEFGELLEAYPELLDTFVRAGRLGRSLGVHLLLASQRLEEGRLRGLEAHLRYRLALRTYTAAESVAVLGTPAAHRLPSRPGSALLAVDGTVTPLLVAMSEPAHRPASARDPVPPFVRRLDATGPAGVAPSAVAAATDRAGPTSARARPVWSPPLPAAVSLADLDARTQAPAPARGVAVGLVDDPRGRSADVLSVDLLSAGHLAVTGAAGSGRSTFLRTVVTAYARGLPSTRLQVVALDLGGGGLAPLSALPHTSAVVGGHDGEAVARLMRHLDCVCAERADLLAAAAMASFDDLEQLAPDEAARLLPDPWRARVLVVVDQVGRLRQEYPDDDATLTRVALTGRALGLHLVVAAARWLDVRPALLDSCGVRVELFTAEPSDSGHGAALARTVPRRAGRGLAPDGRQLLVARADAADTAAAALAADIQAPPVRRLPLVVPEPPAAPGNAGVRRFALGIREHREDTVQLDVGPPGRHLLVLGDDGSGRTTVLQRVVRHLTEHPPAEGLHVHVVDPVHRLTDLATMPAVVSYAYDPESVDALALAVRKELEQRLPPSGLDARRASDPPPAWPVELLVVDDLDLLPTGPGLIDPGGLDRIADLIPRAAGLGLTVVAARRVAGAGRLSYEPFTARLRDAASATALVMSGDRAEGPLVAGVVAAPQPPGRGVVVRRGQKPLLVQGFLPTQP